MTRPGDAGGDTGEDGAVLVLALVFMLVWAVIVYALLDLASTGFEVAGASNDRTDRVYASDGAVETAVAALVADPAPEAGACPAFTAAIADHAVEVACELTVGPNIRVADLTASIDGEPQLRARIRLDDGDAGSVLSILNWTVLP